MLVRLVLLLCCFCYITDGDALDNLKKVPAKRSIRSDSSDIIKAIAREKRHVPEFELKKKSRRRRQELVSPCLPHEDSPPPKEERFSLESKDKLPEKNLPSIRGNFSKISSPLENKPLATKRSAKTMSSEEKCGTASAVEMSYVRGVTYQLIERSQTEEWNKLIESGSGVASVTVAKNVVLDGKHENFEFYVDRSMVSHITILAKGMCDNVTITSPSGRSVSRPFTHSNSFDQLREVMPLEDSRGTWRVTSESKEYVCVVDVTGRATIGFTMSLMTKYPHESDSAYRVVTGNPSKHKSLAVILDGFGMEVLKSGGKDQVELVRFVDKSGDDVIPPVPVANDVNGMNSRFKIYLKDGLKTSKPATVVVEGKDFKGNRFSRVISNPIEPSHVTLTCEPRDIIIQTEVETTFDVRIRNNGTDDSFTVDLSDDHQFTIPKHENYSISSKETASFPVSVKANYKTLEGTKSILTFSVQGTHPGSSQRTTCDIVVGKPSNVRINSLDIEGTINSRFAETVVTSSMTNFADVGLEAKFEMLLPIDAFITNMTMTIDNTTVVGQLDEKEKAKKIYEKAKKKGKAAGHVEARGKSTRVFRTKLFVEPKKNVVFQLTYQQLLRRLGASYKYAVVLKPNQPVKRLRIVVHIEEEEAIAFIKIPFFEAKKDSAIALHHPEGPSITFGNGRRSATIKYSPTLTQQTSLSPLGLSGSFSVRYDVTRSYEYGDVTVSDGYFAHFFSPPNLPSSPRKVMFVIDKSGSMGGNKMYQVKEAMTSILQTLQETDYYGLIFFDDGIQTKDAKIERATRQKVNQGLRSIKAVRRSGGTSIIPAFALAFRKFDPHFMSDGASGAFDGSGENDENASGSGDFDLDAEPDELKDTGYSNMIVFLTDGWGEPGSQVIDFVNKNNHYDLTIHTIAFGKDADTELLSNIAAQNDGTYRMIFDELTAAVQIEDYFDEVANTVLRDVNITYPHDRITDTTNSEFKFLRSQSEIVWAGKIKEEEDFDIERDDPQFGEYISVPTGSPAIINAHASGYFLGERLEMTVPIDPQPSRSHIKSSQHQIANFTERLWAFLQIKQLLNEAVLSRDDANATSLINEKVLNMSLKYHFVTPLTSIVVVLPEDRQEIQEELKREEEERAARIKQRNQALKEKEEKLKQAQRAEELMLLEASRQQKPIRLHGSAVGRGHSSGGGGGGRGGGYGDPHFIIPLSPKINLCFNWDGEEGEVYNLFHDAVGGVSVNGQLVRTTAPEETRRSHRTYISELGIVLMERNLNITVRPDSITFLPADMKNFTLRLRSELMLTVNGVQLRIYDVKFKTAKIELSTAYWSFDVFVTRNIHNHHQASHVDFFVNSYYDHSIVPLNGVVGQFINSKAKLLGNKKANNPEIHINKRSSRVHKIEREQPWSGEKITCWNSHGNARDLIQGTHDHYLVENVLAVPKFYWL